MAWTAFPLVNLRASWPQMAFASQLVILYLAANEIFGYCESLAIILTQNKNISVELRII